MISKRASLLSIFGGLLISLSYGQSLDNNFIKTTELLIPIADTSQINGLDDDEKNDVINYYDGLGRLKQTNHWHASSSHQDIVQHIEYDTIGRQKFDFLPFPHEADGDFLPDAGDKTMDYYDSPGDHTIPQTPFPFSEKDFDDSPLNRVMKQGFPGDSWQLDAHPQHFNYLTNTSNDQVLLFNYSEGTNQFSSSEYYAGQSLYVYKSYDENGNLTRTFKDKSDKIILKEDSLSGAKLRTYYIYDIYDNLAVVIQPEGSCLISGSFSSTSQFIDRWCFTYKYDSQKKLVEKHIPGMKKPIFTVYDSLDRIVLTQDGNLKQSDLYYYSWYFTKYDVLGRPVLEGLYRNLTDTTLIQIQNLADDYISQHSYFESRTNDQYAVLQGYTNNAFPPIDSCEILKVYYYDDYDFDKDGFEDFDYYSFPEFGNLNYFGHPMGMMTGSKVKILIEQVLPDPLLVSVNFYDNKSRIIQQQLQNHFGHFDTLTTKYNFVGDVLLSRYSHASTYEYHVMYDSLVYDHARRLKESYKKIDHQSQFLMASFNYNELGQLIEKNLHRTGTSTYLQSLDYSYNIRGWLNGINKRSNGNDLGDVFFQELVYDSTISALYCEANYNGNITASIWKHSRSLTGKGYGYTYDNLNRLTKAVYGEFGGGNWNINDKYSNPMIDYYDNGNIKRLQRKGPCGTNTTLDDLNYYYDGNRIIGVNDNAAAYCGFMDNGHYFNPNNPENTTEYFYDNNGNLTKDLNKGITSIIYNHLNLPEKIEFENNRRIYYLYDANGTKLQKTYYEDNRLMETTDYSGIFVYKDGHVDYIQTSEGRMYWDNNHHLFYAEYFIKDHLGNVRSVITTNPYYSNSIILITDYYPFGLELQEINASDNLQLYNSKELQTDAKLWWYDYGARFYDPVLGRWHSVDPMAETSRRWSPYTYCMNNPIRFIDPDGMKVTDFLDKDGNKILHVKDGSNAVFKLTGNGKTDEYFKFTGEYSNQGGKNEVSVEGAIAGAQDYVTNNYDKCNQAVNFVGRTYESATQAEGKTVDNIGIVTGTSTAATINSDLASKVTPEESASSAQESAAKGNLVVGTSKSHVVTMTTKTFDITRYNTSGSVIEQKQIVGGQITNVNGNVRETNIGPGQKNSFQPLSWQKSLKWYSFPRN